MVLGGLLLSDTDLAISIGTSMLELNVSGEPPKQTGGSGRSDQDYYSGGGLRSISRKPATGTNLSSKQSFRAIFAHNQRSRMLKSRNKCEKN
jgi:hypothetical protein